MQKPIDIPSLFKDITAKVSARLQARPVKPFAVYFDHGVYDTVNKNLITKDGSISLKNAKYPLVWLVTPLRQVKPRNADYYCELSDVQILILMGTNDSDSEDARIEKYFEPYLRPIYEELLNEIDRSCFFQVLSADAIPHEMKEWTYQSGTEGKYNLFNDFIDAIQIRQMRLLVNESVSGFKIFN